MCEESACLVPPLEQAHNGPTEPRLSTGSTGVASYNGEALVGFHEDALSQAAMGKAQLLLAIVLGLSLAADCSEVTILSYILPAAELHLCIDDHRKGWLISITLLAMSVGSFVWGLLGDRLGRRRALISALSVAVLFSAVASVMPTYGTFMTARFCSGLGISGAFPLSFSYLAETCSRASRSRYTGTLHAFWPLGAIFISIISHITMPTLGADIVQDNREHWSSWHKFLILSILPTVACIIGLMWASESPRYLLEAAREVEALAVYQRLHKLNKTRTQYGLTELELPSRSAYRERPLASGKKVFANGLYSLREAFQSVLSPTHFRTTLLLASLHLLLGFLYMGVSTFSANTIKLLREEEYFSRHHYVENANFTRVFNETIENTQFLNTRFVNSTFTHINFNHVEFINCTMERCEFVNVKSSITYFKDSVIKFSRFIDTDFTGHNFLNSNLTNNTFRSLISDCVVDFDYNIYLDNLYVETMVWSGFMVPALFLLGFVLETVSRPPLIIATMLFTAAASAGIFFMTTTLVVTTIELLCKIFIMCGLNAVTLVVVEGYPCHLRCTAHGLLRSLFHLASLCAIPIYGLLVNAILIFPAIITVAMALIAAVLSTRIQNNAKVLL